MRQSILEIRISELQRSRKILFVSSMPASRSNALGIQILRLAERFCLAWVHCYWYNDCMEKNDVPNSYRMSTVIPYLAVCGRTRIFDSNDRAVWVGLVAKKHLIEWKKPRLRRILGDTEFAYIAPIKNGDVTR